MSVENVIILGNGPAGCTAALYAARAGLKPLIFAGATPGGLLTQTTEVENFPGFVDGVLGFDLVTAMQSQADRFGARLEYDIITSVQLSDGGIHTLISSGGKEYRCRALIIASGAVPRWLGLPNEERLKYHGVSACATCDGAFYAGKRVVVAGGGDTAMEEAVFLARFAEQVFVVHRRSELRASAIMVEKARSNPKITFILNSSITDILGEKKVEGVMIRDLSSGTEEPLACSGYFCALGHVPATGIFKGQLTLDDNGFIVLDDHSSRTSLKGVFAAGDCADPHYRQAITAAGMGCRAAMDVQRYLAESED